MLILIPILAFNSIKFYQVLNKYIVDNYTPILVLQAYIYINYITKIRKSKGKQTLSEAIGGYFYYKNIDNVELFNKNNFINLVKP